MEGERRYHFPVVSARADEPGSDLADESPGGSAVWEETLFEDIGGDWKKGDWGNKIGSLWLIHVAVGAAKAQAIAVFRFDDGPMVVYQGRVPWDGGPWKGRETFRFVTGTGELADRGGEIDVESTNPKHWG